MPRRNAPRRALYASRGPSPIPEPSFEELAQALVAAGKRTLIILDNPTAYLKDASAQREGTR